MRYLLVTHVPFSRSGDRVVLDGLWARDLMGLVTSVGPIRVAAPELPEGASIETWGPSAASIEAASGITFSGFPVVGGRKDLWKWPGIHAHLRREVRQADLVHTSNFFPPYVPLSYAHDIAVRYGKKTLFVIAEDFHDMLAWEWLRLSGTGFSRWRAERALGRMDARVRRSAATASLTFQHTPAAVQRYRLAAANGVAIRQPGHERDDVIAAGDFHKKCTDIADGKPLIVIAACRHKPLKGLDFLIHAVAMLRRQKIPVDVRLYGEGPSTASLRALAERLHVADVVSLPGALPPGNQIYQAIAAGHLFLMPHRTTDFGRAFFDGMAGGTPVIAFRSDASCDTVRDGVDGLLTPMDDVESLAAAIRRCHEDRALTIRLATAARERALVNTRSFWYDFRADLIHSLFAKDAKT